MARKYNTYKFTYTSDTQRDSIRIQREYLNENNQPITPITQLFLDRVLQNPAKFEPKKNSELRHVISYINTEENKFGEFKSYIPYSDIETKSNHIREIDAVERVLCVDYFGEVINHAK